MGRDERGKKFEKHERGREREKLIISNSPGNFLWFFFCFPLFSYGREGEEGKNLRQKLNRSGFYSYSHSFSPEFTFLFCPLFFPSSAPA